MSKPCPIYGKAIYMDCLECEERYCKNMIKNNYKKIVVGIDQSYKNCGISISADGKLLKVKSINLEKYHNNSERRMILKQKLNKMIISIIDKSDQIICIIERIRLRSQGFLNIDYIKSIGALNAIIVDEFSLFNIPVYSVDTRCWKAQVIGTSKPMDNEFGVPPEKWPTMRWVIYKGFEDSVLKPVKGRKTKGTFELNGEKYSYDNDAADSAAISMFGFIGDQTKLKEEK